jgi:hypothetical protein
MQIVRWALYEKHIRALRGTLILKLAQLSGLGLTEFPIRRKYSNHEAQKNEAPTRIALEIGFTIHLVHLAG